MPSDWEDYLLSKGQGAERYKFRNLPNCVSCSGIYELGIAFPPPRSGREVAKLSPKKIVPVYIGQADNIRNRLKQYARDGAHLQKSNSSFKNDPSKLKAHGLFSEIFAKGFCIVYRWIPMSKEEAERTEARLLNTYDYAWNKGLNCARRPSDIHQKLDHMTRSPKRHLLTLNQCERLMYRNESSLHNKLERNDIPLLAFKFGASRPKVVPKDFGSNFTFCGAALGGGYICTRPPVKGRKRCSHHKGKKANGSAKIVIKGGNLLDDAIVQSHFLHSPAGVSHISGITMDDGSLCRRKPVTRMKSCEEHKERKDNKFISSPGVIGEKHYVCGPVLSHAGKSTTRTNMCYDSICGVDLENGEFCTRQPVVGRKRCEEHKGMRVNNGQRYSAFLGYTPRSYADSCSESPFTCGAITRNGSFCSRKPGNDGKFCTQHQRMMFDSCSSPQSFANKSDSYPSTCGAITLNGSFCSRRPGSDGKFCTQHQRMMLDSCSSPRSSVNKSDSYPSTCGAITLKGSYCKRPTTNGRRCFQH